MTARNDKKRGDKTLWFCYSLGNNDFVCVHSCDRVCRRRWERVSKSRRHKSHRWMNSSDTTYYIRYTCKQSAHTHTHSNDPCDTKPTKCKSVTYTSTHEHPEVGTWLNAAPAAQIIFVFRHRIVVSFNSRTLPAAVNRRRITHEKIKTCARSTDSSKSL